MRLKATVAYDGSAFVGWQKQPNGNSVQTEIEKAVSLINKEKTRVFGSGRTDAGVHGLGQVFHFDSPFDIQGKAWIKALNSMLPLTIRIVDVEPVDDSFHARYSAKTKTYEYRVNNGEYDLFKRKYECYYPEKLDLTKIEEACHRFLGEHDFTSFNATKLEVIENQVRTIYRFDFEVIDNHIIFTICGSGFLKYMVRMMIATCLKCGTGKIKPEKITEMLEAKDKDVMQYNIEPNGLYLKKVNY